MRGEILHFDRKTGRGFIRGADDRRYVFHAEDGTSGVPFQKGLRIEFEPDGPEARKIRGATPASAHARQFGRLTTAGAEPQFGRSTTAGAQPPPGLFSYFLRAITRNYARFRGRARRKEYWGYMLFVYVAFAIAVGAGLLLDAALGNSVDEAPVATVTVAGLFWLAAILPSLAMMVRRQHDIGLSGWFILLILIPYIGGLILLVFAFIPSQKHANRWGPVPDGVR